MYLVQAYNLHEQSPSLKSTHQGHRDPENSQGDENYLSNPIELGCDGIKFSCRYPANAKPPRFRDIKSCTVLVYSNKIVLLTGMKFHIKTNMDVRTLRNLNKSVKCYVKG